MILDVPNACQLLDPQELESFGQRYMAQIDPAVLGWATLGGRHIDYFFSLWAAALEADHVVLDVGGACSYFGTYIADMVAAVHIVDNLTFNCTTPWMESLGRFDCFETGKLKVVQCDAEILPYPADTFDRVFSFSALEHFLEDGDSRCVKEIYRVLKPNGLFVGTVDYNAVTETPHPRDAKCRTYTFKSFCQRILNAADFWPIGDMSLVAIPVKITYLASAMFFALQKGSPGVCVPDI